MVIYVWLEEKIQEKEELKYAVMEFGGLSTQEVGTVVMLQLLVDN